MPRRVQFRLVVKQPENEAEGGQAQQNPEPGWHRRLLSIGEELRFGLLTSQESSNVRCHGIPGGLIAYRVHIADSQTTIATRLTLTPEGNYRDRILRCETIRLIEGRLSEAPCFDFTIWIFNKWQAGPPQIPSARRPATARAGQPPAPEVWTTGAETWKSVGESPAMTAAPGTPR